MVHYIVLSILCVKTMVSYVVLYHSRQQILFASCSCQQRAEADSMGLCLQAYRSMSCLAAVVYAMLWPYNDSVVAVG